VIADKTFTGEVTLTAGAASPARLTIDGGDVYSFSNGGKWDGDGGGIHIGWTDTRATFNMTGCGVVAGINGGPPVRP
jgi:hypothetical protein